MTKIFLVANTDWYLYNFRLTLAKVLRSNGYEVSLVSPTGSFVDLIRAEGFRWLEWPVGRLSMEPLGEIRVLDKLRQLYRQQRPDLVHHFTVKPVLYGTLAAHLAGIPLVVDSITGLGYLFIKQDVRIRLVRWLVVQLYRQAFRHPNLAVIYENKNDQDFFIQRGLVRLEQTCVIQGAGVDLEKYSLMPEPEGQPLVVLPARMLWDKGVGVLIEAVRQLKRHRNLRVALVGSVDAGNPTNIPEGTLRRWVSEGVVEWWGFRRDMPEIYRQASIVTLPSMGEGLPTVLLEAAACGRPIVATDVSGCREVVVDGETGLLVPPNDPFALAAALEKLLDDPSLRQRLGHNGRRRVEALFSDQQINDQTLQVYKKLFI